MSIRIGSFNMYKFSERSEKNINKIAEIIYKEQFDIIALQEVYTDNAARRVVEHLNNMGSCVWDYRWEQPKIGIGYSKSGISAEGYAFIWRTDTIELSTTRKMDPSQPSVSKIVKVEPHIFDQYRIDRSRQQKELARNPYYGRFKPKNQFIELRLINVHIRYGKDDDESLGAIALRKNEFEVLTKCIYPKISNRRYGNNMPSYTILLGDYNLELKSEMTKGPYLQEVVIYEDYEKSGGADMRSGMTQQIITVQKELSTLKRNLDGEADDPRIRGFAHNYDHFTYDKLRFKGVSVKPRTINTVSKLNDDFALHRKEISDHLPIMVTLKLNPDRNEQIQ